VTSQYEGRGHLESDLEQRLARLTLEQKVRLLSGADFWSLHPEPAIGLRRVVVSEPGRCPR
jgi:beta-glucosidase